MLIDLRRCSRRRIFVAALPLTMLVLALSLAWWFGTSLSGEDAKWPAWLFLAAFFWGYGVLAQATMSALKKDS